MKNLIFAILTILEGNSLAQSTNYTVTYEGAPACYTTFTISDTNNNILGSGKSDASGTFSCDYDVENTDVFLLKATPEKGKGWELQIPIEAIESAGADYDIPLENVEAMMKEAFEMQNDMLGEANEQNDEMNRQSGSMQGTEELGIIGGIVKVGQTLGDAQFKLIRISIGKSCADAANSMIKIPEGNKKGTETNNTGNDAKQVNTEDKKDEKTEDKVQDKQTKEEPVLSKKDLKAQEEAELAKAKEAEKEAERIEKERKEAELREQERLEEEAEAAAEDLNFTDEEFAQMSFVDLNKKQAYCETAILRNKMKLSTRSAFLKEDEKATIENRIIELETASAAIEGELARRKTESEAKKAAKEAEKEKQ
jgi:hypothetical protein